MGIGDLNSCTTMGLLAGRSVSLGGTPSLIILRYIRLMIFAKNINPS
jgi:hypothetical protein